MVGKVVQLLVLLVALLPFVIATAPAITFGLPSRYIEPNTGTGTH